MKINREIRQIALENLRPTESVIRAEVKIAEIARIIKRYGWFGDSATAIKDEIDETIYLLDGHHRFAAAKDAGSVEVPVIFVEFSELAEFYLYYNSMEDIRQAAGDVKKFR